MTLVLAVLFLVQAGPTATQSPTLINERNAKAQFRDGVLELRSGNGWMRTEHPLLDFKLTFEIRGRTPDADPGLILRTWTGRGRWPDKGYRLTLPFGTPTAASTLLIGGSSNSRLSTRVNSGSGLRASGSACMSKGSGGASASR